MQFWSSVNVTNHTGMWDAKLAWVLLSGFTSVAWSTASECMVLSQLAISSIVNVLVIQVKFIEPSGYGTVINCTLTFHTTNVFGSFWCYGTVQTHKEQVPVLDYIAHSSVQLSNSNGEKQYTKCQCKMYNDTTNPSK